MGYDSWNNLLIDTTARPQPLAEERFREWVAGKGIFISSRRDAEMNPVRQAARKYLYEIGAHPIMWEEMTPRDEASEQAYLNGVDQSDIFVLLVGRSYGIADFTGYSPIHKEGNQATKRKIPRLLFMLEGIQDSERDGRLNDWLLSLYKEVSVASFSTTHSFVSQLDARLREMAARSYRFWIKLGNLVFPGLVKSESIPSRGGNHFTVTARVTQGSVRHALLSLGKPYRSDQAYINSITWSDQSFPIQVDSVSTDSEFTTENLVRIECTTPQNFHGYSGDTSRMISVGGGVRGNSLGPADLAYIWATLAIFGKEVEIDSSLLSLAQSFTRPDTSPLPELLRKTKASGWIAEGLTRLYIVEEFLQRYPGYFEYLNVEPATATGVRVDASFVIVSSSIADKKPIRIQGFVPIVG
ncbi:MULTISPECIES: DUF4062 domain-containing protein [unclassified Microcoleus]|uniref:DUF4062 domain-containing protein n=1 Tax=unclassified Microcoleus TaxID=2642155 RepID=UPI002FD6CA01